MAVTVKVGVPNDDVNPDGAVKGTTITGSGDPKLAVAVTPDSSTEYSTPQPELPHSCLPQPCVLKAPIDPTADDKPVGAVSVISTES